MKKKSLVYVDYCVEAKFRNFDGKEEIVVEVFKARTERMAKRMLEDMYPDWTLKSFRIVWKRHLARRAPLL